MILGNTYYWTDITFIISQSNDAFANGFVYVTFQHMLNVLIALNFVKNYTELSNCIIQILDNYKKPLLNANSKQICKLSNPQIKKIGMKA